MYDITVVGLFQNLFVWSVMGLAIAYIISKCKQKSYHNLKEEHKMTRKMNKAKYVEAAKMIEGITIEFCDHAEWVEIYYYGFLLGRVDYSTLTYCYFRREAFAKEIWHFVEEVRYGLQNSV